MVRVACRMYIYMVRVARRPVPRELAENVGPTRQRVLFRLQAQHASAFAHHEPVCVCVCVCVCVLEYVYVYKCMY